MLLRGVSLDLGPGDALHLTGRNGNGKSSLLRIPAGLARPFAGRVAATGMVALADERLPLDAHRPLGAALDFWRRIDRSAAAIAAFALDDLAQVPVRFLSTGQKKRAGLAMIAAQGAPIWLLDEPLNGLDRDWRARIAEQVAAHRAQGGIVVIASHLAPGLADCAELPLERFVP